MAETEGINDPRRASSGFAAVERVRDTRRSKVLLKHRNEEDGMGHAGRVQRSSRSDESSGTSLSPLHPPSLREVAQLSHNYSEPSTTLRRRATANLTWLCLPYRERGRSRLFKF